MGRLIAIFPEVIVKSVTKNETAVDPDWGWRSEFVDCIGSLGVYQSDRGYFIYFHPQDERDYFYSSIGTLELELGNIRLITKNSIYEFEYAHGQRGLCEDTIDNNDVGAAIQIHNIKADCN